MKIQNKPKWIRVLKKNHELSKDEVKRRKTSNNDEMTSRTVAQEFR